MIVPVVPLASLPAEGQPASKLNEVVPGAVFVKRQGYNAVDLAIRTPELTGSFAIYRHNPDLNGWYPEGPRDVTPTVFSPNLPNNIPIRISMPFVEVLICVVQTTLVDPDNFTASLVEANR